MSDTPSTNSVNDETFRRFQSTHQGQLIRPGDEVYDEARRVWNGMIDRYPALIVRCAGVEDVIAAVNFARENHLRVAVRAGGHSVAGHATCDEGLVVDLSMMKHIQVDPAAHTARVQGGVTWGELDAATQVHSLATPGGLVSVTGIAGLTLGGGFGWLRNKYGLSCDNLISAEVVTADGRVITASKDENQDLLWGLRGGGGNFGIVTTFEYQLHPVGPDVMFVFVLYDGTGENLNKGLRFYRDFCKRVPDEASTIAVCGKVPPEPAYPAELHENPYVLFGGLYAGPVEEGKRVLQPLLDFGQPLLDYSGIQPYVDAQKAWDADYPDGKRYYWKSLNLISLDDHAIQRIANHARQQPSVHSTIDLWHIGGAVARVSAEASAFHGRQAAFLLSPEANWEDEADDKANIVWLRNFIADMAPFSDGSRYLNFAGFQEEEEMMRKAFGSQYERLVALKNKYDPTNLFNLNQNIKPTV
ncbi:MAG: FAD-binding oxidoreductase [Anaerolineae bacterium]|nr:FAD-binding oxidoreductase [Anaerolineae bacterium]